jgi:hypothetical protein
LGMIVDKCRAIVSVTSETDIDRALTSDPLNRKIVSFRRNLAGDTHTVTVDRWAFRVATQFSDCEFGGSAPCARNRKGMLTGRGHKCGRVPTGAEYEAMADAYRLVASEFAESPADTQAITWCVVRGTGE